MGGALGGGVMALLGAMAFKAMKDSGQEQARVPLGLAKPGPNPRCRNWNNAPNWCSGQ